MNPETPPPRPEHVLATFRWPLVIVALALVALFAFLTFLWVTKRTYDQTLARGGKAGEYAVQKAEAIAEKFMSGNITRTFLAAIPEITSTGAGNLELATSDQTEAFRAEDQKSIFWDKLYLGKTVSEIRVPVTYRYHLRLADPWRLDVSGQSCIVVAPSIRPSLPPAIHTDRMEKRSDEGWARFNAREQMAGLEKSITPTLSTYAVDKKHIDLVREQCRRTVAEFVKTWLLKEDHWRTDRFHTIKVIFADETNAAPEQVAPTIQLK
ncbi:MAG: hypothetical protein DME18_16655 [Verrucomicrobia bacterium]|nr:MAG: hypothetical protein DME18_16655 [Verrucomicrobiota bacterium]